MDQIVIGFLVFVGILFGVSVGGFAWVSFQEGEQRAARIAFWAALAGVGVFLGLALAPHPLPRIAFWTTIAIGIVMGAAFLLPVGRVGPGMQTPQQRFDERQIMFARHRLQPDTPVYQAYYHQDPDHEDVDNHIRSLPGLLSPDARLANPFQYAPVSGSFFLTESLYEAVDVPVAEVQQPLPAEQMTQYLKVLARYFGADQVGVTELQPYHVYSHIGRGSGVYGEPISRDHKVALGQTKRRPKRPVQAGLLWSGNRLK